MIEKSAVATTALVLCLGMFAAGPVGAQPASGMARQAGMSEHHQRMGEMMKDTSQEISKMTELISRVDLTARAEKADEPTHGTHVQVDASHVRSPGQTGNERVLGAEAAGSGA